MVTPNNTEKEVLSLSEIQSATDLDGKVASAESIKTVNRKVDALKAISADVYSPGTYWYKIAEYTGRGGGWCVASIMLFVNASIFVCEYGWDPNLQSFCIGDRTKIKLLCGLSSGSIGWKVVDGKANLYVKLWCYNSYTFIANKYEGAPSIIVLQSPVCDGLVSSTSDLDYYI